VEEITLQETPAEGEIVEEEDEIATDPPAPPISTSTSENGEDESKDDDEPLEPLQVELHPIEPESDVVTTPNAPSTSNQALDAPIYEDPEDEDDGEGEWITQSNIGIHKSRAMGLLPSTSGKTKHKEEKISVGCMTADFAMQNVLLQMGLNLVSTEGKRIDRVKSWVLRCHACFK